MKIYACGNCNNLLYFENSTCLVCSLTVGFDAGKLEMVTLENDTNGYAHLHDKNERYRFCSNAIHGTCNWLVPVSQSSQFCTACELNRTIPLLTNINNQQKWQRIETAKHRMVYSLLRLQLPVKPKINENETEGIAFDFIGDHSPTEKVLTGHDNGNITLNIEEADESARTLHKLDLGEKYRTLLGHFRHEIGHYYWEILIKNSTLLEKFRQLFGDDQKDYPQSLETYYNTDTPANWNDFFISPYASAHPWEDWAESWAHYMHMMDTLETTWSLGIGIHPENRQAAIYNDPYTTANFDDIINRWFSLTFAVNNLNRSMGQADFYPFIISSPVIEKLRFIHEVVGGGGKN